MPLHIVRQVSAGIHASKYYSKMADECTDIANKEQFTTCRLRWVDDDMDDHKDFIGIYQVDSNDASSLVRAIKDTLIRLNLPISDCRDGAST